jgi:hypothetical protein
MSLITNQILPGRWVLAEVINGWGLALVRVRFFKQIAHESWQELFFRFSNPDNFTNYHP